MADVTLRVRLATEQADRDAARFRDRLTAGLKSANESLERIGKTQAFTGLVLAGELFFKSAELGAKAVKAIASGIADATTAAVDAGKASATFVRGLEAAEKSSRAMVESFGEAVSRSGAVQSGLAAVDEAARSLTAFFDSPEGRGAVDGFFRALSAGAAGAINAVLGARSAFNDLADFLDRRAIAWGLKGASAEPLYAEEPAWVQTAQQLADRLAGAGTAPRRVDTGARGVRSDAARVAAETEAERLRSQHEAERKQLADRDAFFREGLQRQREALEQAEFVRERMFEIELRNEERREAIRTEAEQRREEERRLTMSLAIERRQQELANYGEVVSAGAQVLSETIGAALVAGVEGFDVGQALRQAVGNAMVAFGTHMIAASIYAAIVGPIEGLLGNPAGWLALALAPAAGAAGLGMVAAGRAIGGSGSSLSPSGALTQPRGRPQPMAGSLASSAPAGFQSTPPRDPAPAVTIVVQGAIVGSAAELGRYIERALAASGRLRVGAT